MDQPLAYHVVVHALEGRGDWAPTSRFAAMVAHTNNGHLPYQRHHSAGLRRASMGTTESQIERAVMEFLILDATPGVQVLASLRSPSVLVAGFNAYNASAKIAVKTRVSVAPNTGDRPAVSAKRDMRVQATDPAPCRDATLALFNAMLSPRGAGPAPSGQRRFKCLTSLADVVGARGAAVDAARVFEDQGAMRIVELARALGCHQRTLERKLKEEGMTAESLRQAVRLLRAMARLPSTESLTDIAIAEGFSDLAHMTKAFQTAAGLPPSVLRQLFRADDQANR